MNTTHTPIPTPLRGFADSLGDVLERLMDDGVISDYADEFGERGYSATGPVLLGNYWCRRAECRDAGRELHDVAEHYPAEWALLESLGAVTEWEDEWYVSHESSPSRAWRTTGDSYSWQSSLLWCDGYVLTPDDDIAEWIAEVVDNPRRCLPGNVWGTADLIAEGFAERECGFESGWYGVEDDPSAITAAIRETDPDCEIVFQLSSAEQFRVTFCVFVRPADWEAPED